MNKGMVMWPDGTYEVLPDNHHAWAGVLVCPRTGEVLARWMWGTTPFSLYAMHPTDKHCPLFEDDTWWPTTKVHFPIQVLRRIFLYMCEEADREGVL